MKLDLKIEHLGKKEQKTDEKDMYHISFKIRHIIQVLDNAII